MSALARSVPTLLVAALACAATMAQGELARTAPADAQLARLLALVERLSANARAPGTLRPGTIDDMIHRHALLAGSRTMIAARIAVLRREQAVDYAPRVLVAPPLPPAGSRGQFADLAALPLPEPGGGAAAGEPNGAYRLPASGSVVVGTGERGETGFQARGLTIATAPSAEVAAPALGRVAYAGRFGGYGRIVILDHGHGWTTLLAGLDGTSVHEGGLAAQGSGIGRMAARTPRLTIELRHNGRPVDVAGMAAQ